MISSTTPYKLAEIIRDTWPGLYRTSNKWYTDQAKNKSNQSNSTDNKV